MGKDHFHLEFAPGWLLEDANALSCGACPHHKLVQVNMGPSTMRFTFEAFQAFTNLMQRMADQITHTQEVTNPSPVSSEMGSGGKVISGIFTQNEKH